MAKGVLDGVAWETVEVFGDTPKGPVVVVPEAPPPEATMLLGKVCKTLNMTKGGVKRYIDSGRLVPVAESPNGHRLYDRTQVEELAADIEARRGERRLSGTAKDMRGLENKQGFTMDPRLLERGVRERSGETREEQRHVELISTLRGIQEEISSSGTRIAREIRLLDQRLTSIESSFASLNMGALMAALVAGGVAIAPDDLKQKAKDRFDGLIRPHGPHGAAARTAAAVTAPVVAPEGPRLNVFGEVLATPPLSDTELTAAGDELNRFLTKLRTPAG